MTHLNTRGDVSPLLLRHDDLMLQDQGIGIYTHCSSNHRQHRKLVLYARSHLLDDTTINQLCQRRISGYISFDVSSLRKLFHLCPTIGSMTAKNMHVGLLRRHAQPRSYPRIDKHSQDPDFHGQGWSATPQRSKQQGAPCFLFLDFGPKDRWRGA